MAEAPQQTQGKETAEKPRTVEGWMQRHGKEPYRSPNNGKFHWGAGPFSLGNWDLFIALSGERGPNDAHYREYDTREAAIAALDVALRKCGELAESHPLRDSVPEEQLQGYDELMDEIKTHADNVSPSPLEALAEKWEKEPPIITGKAHWRCAAELREALAKIEPSEEEVDAAADYVHAKVNDFDQGVRWMLARINSTKGGA